MKNNLYRYNLGQLFESVVEKNPTKIALKYTNGDTCTLGQLDRLANQMAMFLQSKGIKRLDPIAILHNKSKDAYAIMIACLKLGAIYTNIDPKSPPQRFNKMIKLTEPKIIFHFGNQDLVSNKILDSNAITTINYQEGDFIREREKPYEGSLIPTEEVTGNTPAYIMFTSGSTGFPKGVVISHTHITNFIQWAKKTYDVKKDDFFTNINPMHFDNSVFDFYASLFNEAGLIPVSESLTKNPRKLILALNDTKPTVWFSVPSMLVYVLNMRALQKDDLSSLRIVTFGGEGFPKNQLRKLWEILGNRVQFINVYGPTECTCICSSYPVTSQDMESDDLLPLGPMSENFNGLVLDEKGRQVETGKIGELYIGGPNVGLGYYNNPEKTAESFVDHPFIKTHSEKLYKSGDLVRYDHLTKNYRFLGRSDNQIKRMGYRIELEEIENALNTSTQIKECAVIYPQAGNFKQKVVSIIHGNENREHNIKKELEDLLPLYMMPDFYFFVNDLPKNQNGKIDRIELKKQWESQEKT